VDAGRIGVLRAVVVASELLLPTTAAAQPTLGYVGTDGPPFYVGEVFRYSVWYPGPSPVTHIRLTLPAALEVVEVTDPFAPPSEVFLPGTCGLPSGPPFDTSCVCQNCYSAGGSGLGVQISLGPPYSVVYGDASGLQDTSISEMWITVRVRNNTDCGQVGATAWFNSTPVPGAGADN
jgi:hypothetical protein